MIAAAYSVLVRSQASRGRLLAIGGLGALVVLVAIAIAASEDNSPEELVDAVNGLGLALYVPITALVFASAAFGEMVEDQTLVYLWARPIRRVELTLAAVGSSLTISLPCVLVPMFLAAVIIEPDAGFVAGTVVASAASTIAYAALFVGLGARIPRALVWGLVYIVVWEGILGSVGAGIARTSLRLYADSLLREIAGFDLEKFGVGAATATVVLVLVTAAGMALTTAILSRADVA